MRYAVAQAAKHEGREAALSEQRIVLMVAMAVSTVEVDSPYELF